jgi:translocation and assembly module TamB
MPKSAPVEEEDSGPLNLSTPYPIALYRVALDNVNIKIDDTTVSVMDFTSGLRWQEKNLTLTPTSLQGLLIALPKVADVAQEEIVEPKIQNPQPEEKPLGETLKDLFSKPVLPEMTDVHLPLNLNIEEFKGEQLRLTGDTDLTVYNMLLKVSSIDGNMKLDALDIDTNQGSVNASGNALLRDNWPVDITLNSALNIDPLKGEKVKVKVGRRCARSWMSGSISPARWTWSCAQTQLAEAGLPLNLEVVSKQLYWPFTGEKQFQADDLKLKLSGKMTDYALVPHRSEGAGRAAREHHAGCEGQRTAG